MSKAKIVLLVLYAVLAALAVSQAGTQVGVIVRWIILALLVIHTVELAVFFPLCRKADGSLGGHVISLFLFGLLHVKELRDAGS
jgi:uncharacterized protein YhhL (DUF1145 family)